MTQDYSIPKEATAILKKLARDPRLETPAEVIAAADKVVITGSDAPLLPIPWKFADAISALKGLEGAWGEVLASERYGQKAQSVSLDSDAATLFVFAAFVASLDGKTVFDPSIRDRLKDYDIHQSLGRRYRGLATNVYETKDGRFFHTHGSLNAGPTQTMLGVEHFRDDLTLHGDIIPIYQDAVKKFTAEELDKLANEKYRQAGTICYTVEESRQTEQGKAIANSPIYELTPAPSNASLPNTPYPWPSAPPNSLPLYGIKVLDLSRIIAAPAIARGLAEMGATVLRISSADLADMNILHLDLHQGKFQAQLNLKSEEGKAKLRELIKDADVFIDGYRPGALERLGFGREAVNDLVKERPNGRGIVYLRENAYGWKGPWVGRSGWQQISDCFTGVSWGFGLAQGLKEAVVPIFPNSDYGTGCIGTIGAIHALYQRSHKGGSYFVDASLSYYNLFLISLGQYPKEVWDKVYKPFAATPFRHYHDMTYTLPVAIPRVLRANPHLQDSKYWTEVDAPAYKAKLKTVAPVVQYGQMKVGFARPTAPPGTDAPEWPKE